MRVRITIIGVALFAPTSAFAQQKPEAVVRAFFQAEDESRWSDAAGMLDLQAFEHIRRTAVEGLRNLKDYPPPTVESMMRMDPRMPRAVAEYQVKQWQLEASPNEIMSQQFARVTSVDTLAALPVQEAAARWLEAKSPEWRTELTWRHERGRPQVSCPGMSDSAVRALSLRGAKETRAVIRGATPDTGSVSYVVIEVVYPRPAATDSLEIGRGPLPRAIILRKVAGVWKIEPAVDLPGANGMGGNYSFSIGCERPNVAGKSPPNR